MIIWMKTGNVVAKRLLFLPVCHSLGPSVLKCKCIDLTKAMSSLKLCRYFTQCICAYYQEIPIPIFWGVGDFRYFFTDNFSPIFNLVMNSFKAHLLFNRCKDVIETLLTLRTQCVILQKTRKIRFF